MRIIYIFSALILLCSPAIAESWKELKSEHFIVYYLEDDKFAEDVSASAERYYSKIASDLGYSRYDNFWTWDNRVKIYVYKSREDYLKATAAKEWSYGMCIYSKKFIISYAHSGKFLNMLLPHEMTHLVFRDFVGFKGEVPVWLDEGVAQWEEEGKRKIAETILKELIAKKELIPLAALMQMNVEEESSAGISKKFYVEAVTITSFMINQYGTEKFTLFCRQLRDGSTVNDALGFVYSDSIRNVDELEKEWLKYYGG